MSQKIEINPCQQIDANDFSSAYSLRRGVIGRRRLVAFKGVSQANHNHKMTSASAYDADASSSSAGTGSNSTMTKQPKAPKHDLTSLNAELAAHGWTKRPLHLSGMSERETSEVVGVIYEIVSSAQVRQRRGIS